MRSDGRAAMNLVRVREHDMIERFVRLLSDLPGELWEKLVDDDIWLVIGSWVHTKQVCTCVAASGLGGRPQKGGRGM